MYRVWYYAWFQASTRGLGMYLPQMRGLLQFNIKLGEQQGFHGFHKPLYRLNTAKFFYLYKVN